MKKVIVQLAGGVLLTLGMVGGAFAASAETAAGTNVLNTATVNYNVGTVAQAAVDSNVDNFEVDAKVDLVVNWEDAANVTVIPGSTQEVLEFTVTNTGNATQGIALTVAGAAGDQFDMNTIGIYIDDGDGIFNAADTLYSAASNAGDLDPYSLTGGDVITVFLISETPPTGGGTAPLDGQTAGYVLTAQALDAGTANVTGESATNDATVVDVIFADGAGATDVAEDGLHSDTGTYVVGTAELTITKSSVVIDDGLDGAPGANEFAIPGATVRYTISIANGGSSPAFIPDDNVINTTDGLSDDIDDSLVSYVVNSVVVGGFGINDGASDGVNFGTDTVRVTVTDADATVAAFDRIQVNGLTIPAASTVVITFDVVIL